MLFSLEADEAPALRSGDELVLSKTAKSMFVNVVRRNMLTLPPDHADWLPGMRDPQIGATLKLLDCTGHTNGHCF